MTHHHIRELLLPALLATALLPACSKQQPDEALAAADEQYAVSIMAFNVENLFDNVDDPGKDDKAYLPIEAKQSQAHIDACNEIEVDRWRSECLLLDWSEQAIAYKISVLADTIEQIDGGRGPDIIALQEVENIRILERLRAALPKSGYLPPVLIEGDDKRGIDVAFLTRLPLAEPARLREADFSDYPDRAGDTRAVLEATFELPDGSLLTGYSVHFPAPFHPTEMRIVAYEHLNTLRAELPAERYAFAAGDFNTTSTESEQNGMLERFVRPHWQVAHEYCADCVGTHYYARDDRWSFLDMVLFSPAANTDKPWAIKPGSAVVANRTEEQVTLSGTPKRFNWEELSGVSDHWPMLVTIER
jgi:endonuclease/exonuclease/phosphatase family metal-dependent hydrolase